MIAYAQKGKLHEQTIVACIGKLVLIKNAILKTAMPFNAKIATA